MTEPTGYTAVGMVGFTDQGTYSASASYVKNDLVHYGGNIWRCLIDDTTGITPTEGTNWTLFVGESTNMAERIIAPLEVSPSANAYSVGEQLIFNDVLYKAKTAIAVGDALVVDTNIELAPKVTSQIQTLTNLMQAVTPDKYGAIGDGTTDDTVAFQNAINDAFLLYLPQGKTYKVSTITVPKGHSIIGNGAISLSDSTTNGIVLSGNNRIEGITVSDLLETYDSSYSAIYGDTVNNCIIKNVHISNLHIGYAIRFDKSEKCEISYNSIIDYSYSGIMLINGCHNISIEHNYIYNARNPQNSNSYPISISGYFTEYDDCARNIKCNYNHIKENTPVWEGIDSHGVVNAEIAFNIIEGTSRGIVMGGGPTSGGNNSIPENNKNISIHHNNITFDNGILYGQGIIVQTNLKSVDHKLENVVIDSNSIKSLNTPTALTTLTAMIGISLNSADCDNLKITNNFINGKNVGIGVDTYNDGSVGIIEISGNDISGGDAAAYNAITLQYMQRPFNLIDIFNNNIHDITTGTDIRGFTTNGGTSMVNYHNNIDNGNYANTLYVTCPKASFNTSLAAGKIGDFVPSTASDSSPGWFCKSAGNWIAI